ncbi:MAG: GtrA family protein [Acidimicrobiaceae bacterium]|nr:GtrA family protein [Acidimicrobiaceae bacterium]
MMPPQRCKLRMPGRRRPAIVCDPVSASPMSTLQRLRAEHGLKALRYCGVSVVNVSVGVSVLAICHGLLGWPAVGANLAAWMVSTVPAYLLSRAWVWQRSGPHRLAGEVLTFWVMALIGLLLSSAAVWVVEEFTSETVFVVAGNLAAYGTVWVAKYVFLDRVMWPRARSN